MAKLHQKPGKYCKQVCFFYIRLVFFWFLFFLSMHLNYYV